MTEALAGAEVLFGRALDVLVEGVVLERLAHLLQLGLVDLDDRLAIGRTTHSGGRGGEELDVAGAHIAHLERGGGDVLGGEAAVDVHVRGEVGDHVGDLLRVRQGVGGDHLVDQTLDEGLLIAGALEVAVGELLAFAHEGQRLLTVEVVLTLDELMAVAGEGLLGVHGHPAEAVGEPLESLEVDDGDVVDLVVDEVRDGGHGQGQAAVGQGGVDLRLAVALDVDPGVTRDRHHLDVRPGLGQVHDHHRVRAQPAAVVHVDFAHRLVGAEQQDVRPLLVVLLLGLRGAEDLFVGELVGRLVEVASDVPQIEADAEDAEHDDDDGRHQDLAPHPPLLAGPLRLFVLLAEQIVEIAVVRHRHSSRVKRGGAARSSRT